MLHASESSVNEFVQEKLGKFVVDDHEETKYDNNPDKEKNENYDDDDDPSRNSLRIEMEKGRKEEAKVIKVLIFLPRSFHLLLLFRIGASRTIVKIRTDYWRCLSFVDPFFDAAFDPSRPHTKLTTNV